MKCEKKKKKGFQLRDVILILEKEEFSYNIMYLYKITNVLEYTVLFTPLKWVKTVPCSAEAKNAGSCISSWYGG